MGSSSRAAGAREPTAGFGVHIVGLQRCATFVEQRMQPAWDLRGGLHIDYPVLSLFARRQNPREIRKGAFDAGPPSNRLIPSMTHPATTKQDKPRYQASRGYGAPGEPNGRDHPPARGLLGYTDDREADGQ